MDRSQQPSPSSEKPAQNELSRALVAFAGALVGAGLFALLLSRSGY